MVHSRGSTPPVPVILGSRADELGLEAETAAGPEELFRGPEGYSFYVCAPADRGEAESLSAALDSGDRSDTLRITAPPREGMDLPGVSVGSQWLIGRLFEVADARVPLLDQDGPFGGMLARAMEGNLLPLFVHNVNNLMVGAMGNIDLATLFSRDPDKCQSKLKDASAAMRRLSEFMSDLGAVSQQLPDREAPADWADLQSVLTMGRLACGRSVNLAVEPDDLPGTGAVGSGRAVTGRTLRTVFACLMTAALTAVRGCGEIAVSVDTELPSVRLSWSRGQQDTGRYGSTESVVMSLLAALSATPPCCGSLRVPAWDDGSGEAVLLPGPTGC
jgi:hypothetical protein